MGKVDLETIMVLIPPTRENVQACRSWNVDVLNPNHMHSFQRSEKSIAILFESVLGFPVEVRASLASLPETSVSRLYKPAPTCQGEQHRIIEKHSINGCYKDDEDLLLKTPTLQAQQRVFQKQSINGCYQESNHPPTSAMLVKFGNDFCMGISMHYCERLMA